MRYQYRFFFSFDPNYFWESSDNPLTSCDIMHNKSTYMHKVTTTMYSRMSRDDAIIMNYESRTT